MIARSSKRGVALILVLMSLALMAVLAIEINVASRIDLSIGRNARDRLQAHYLANSAARFALLRLLLYREVSNLKATGSTPIPIDDQTVDGIWSFPLPNLPFPGMEAPGWPGSFSASVTPEGSKIPVNLLDGNKARGSSEEIANQVRKQLDNLLEGLLEDEEFDKLYRGIKPADLFDPLADWVDADNNKRDGGEEIRDYEREDPAYKPRNDRMPTLTEMYMISGWTDDLYKRISPHLSVLNTRQEINPNYVSLERLRTFEPKLTAEDMIVIQKRRLEGPFASLDDLATFIRSSPDIRGGRDFKFPENIKEALKETIFLVKGSGVVGDVRRDIQFGVRFTEERARGSGSGSQGSGSSAGRNKGKLRAPDIVLIKESL